MPNSKSAAKRLLTNSKKQSWNRVRKSRIKTSEKKFFGALEAGDMELAKASLDACFTALDKAAKRHVISKNKASRKKARLTARLSAAGK